MLLLNNAMMLCACCGGGRKSLAVNPSCALCYRFAIEVAGVVIIRFVRPVAAIVGGCFDLRMLGRNMT